jgi:endonuclease/exonuclease/phosphatase family metal-dependent hydrolase
MELRVVTWNIRAAIGPGPFPGRWWTRIDADRLRAIGSMVAGLDADVVALQEVALVSRSGDLVDNAGDLARQLGMEVRYGAVRTFPVTDGDAVTGTGSFGNALLSRLPMTRSRTVALPMATADAFVEPPGADHPAAGIRWADAPDHMREPRCVLLADIAGITVGTAHLSHNGSGERLLQAEATVAAWSRPGGSPARRPECLDRGAGARTLRRLGRWLLGTGRGSRPNHDRRRPTDRPCARAPRIGPRLSGGA